MDRREAQQYQRSSRRGKRRKRKKKAQYKFFRILLWGIGLLLVLLLILLGRSLMDHTKLKEVMMTWNLGTADIVLDAGHGGKDQGASYGEVLEKELTLEIALKTQKILEDAGYRVAMTREDDTFVELSERAEYANKKNAQVFVSIHCNSSEEEAEGIETFYGEAREDSSRELAESIQNSLIGQTGAKDREAKSASYTVIVRTEMPAALAEVGFLSGSNERALLQKEEYQEKLANGIAEGILQYLEQSEE